MNCSHCNHKITQVFADLSFAPISNSMLTEERMHLSEKYYPLKVFVCQQCKLVQVDDVNNPEDHFNEEYTYYSSFSTSWLQHSQRYVDMMMEKYPLDQNSQVIEIGSNDGYLLQYFKEYNVPVLGIDPSEGTDKVAEQKGIPTISDFFGSRIAKQEIVEKNRKADLIIGNNVLAHDPRINDIVKGLKMALKPNGIITIEFPQLLRLVEDCQFDTIYHEHYFYYSLISIRNIFNSAGLEIFDVEELSTHGGSLRIHACHAENDMAKIGIRVRDQLQKEINAGLTGEDYYKGFQSRINTIRNHALTFLLAEHAKGKTFVGYGAASKGNTFLNYCGIKGTDLINFVVDASTYKQGKFLPGSHIPVVNEDRIREFKPDYIIILPWNLREEIVEQLAYVREWGAKFVIFIPELSVF